MAQQVKNLPAMWETWVLSLGWEDTLEKGMGTYSSILGASLVTQTVKTLPAMWETWVRSLGWEDPLEEDMTTYSRILTWRVLMDRGVWRATVQGVTKIQT